MSVRVISPINVISSSSKELRESLVSNNTGLNPFIILSVTIIPSICAILTYKYFKKLYKPKGTM